MKSIGITECKIMKDSEIDNNRYIDCADYDDCLSEAVAKNMRSFHCNNCHAFQEYQKAQKEDFSREFKESYVCRFRPGHMDLDKKNIGTLWND